MNPPPGYPPYGMPMGYPTPMPGYPPMGMPAPGYPPYGSPYMAPPPYGGPMGMPHPGMGMPPPGGMPPPMHMGGPPMGMPPGGGPPGAMRISTISAPPRMVGVETTVYVGKIPASASDDFVEKLLQQCGKVTNWKRMNDPVSNTPRPFGFVRFENEEGALRALRLLNNFEIDGNRLLLNVDDKTKDALDRYAKNKAAADSLKPADGSAQGGSGPSANDGESATDDNSDEAVLAKIKALISEKKAGDFLNAVTTGTSEDGEPSEKKDDDKHGAGATSWEKELERERREREKERAKERDRRRAERERETRKRERDEREYREMEREWEAREREKERLRERRDKEETWEREKQIERELNFDEEEDRRRRKAGKRRKEREKEELDDSEDRKREIEEEQARIEAERKRQEEELRRQQEEAERRENGLTPVSPDSAETKIKLGLRITPSTMMKPKLGLTPGFTIEEEQNSLTNPKKKKLIPLDPMKTEEQVKKEKEDEAKQIVAMIPAGKEDLFQFGLDWAIIDKAEIIPKKMKPWITKKIVEYLGEEEATLIEFILAKMSSHMAPQELLDQLAFVLEDEAEMFVIKLWRMLIFEMIRAQKAEEQNIPAVQ